MTHKSVPGMSSRAKTCPLPHRQATRRAVIVLGQLAIVWAAACSNDGTTEPGAFSAPTNVAVISTLEHRVVISWDAVPEASGYNLYRSTTAGVTPANGTKIPATTAYGDAGRFSFTDSVATAGTYYYVVTALGHGESDPSSEVRAEVSDLISFTVDYPVPGTVVMDSVFVRAFAQSTFEIAGVTAAADGRQASLVPFIDHGSVRWAGFLDLRGLPPGPKNVTVTIRDVRGNQVQTVIPVQFNLPPVITVEAPLPYTVARPMLQVNATCTVGNAPCQTFELNVGSTTLVSSTTGSVNTTVDLSQFGVDAGSLQLRFDGYSASGAHTRRELVRVFVEPSSALAEYATLPGRALDVQPGRVLWRDSTSATTVTLKIRDVATGADTPVPVTNASFEPAFLTPTGAVFVATTGTSSVAYEWRNDVLTTLATTEISQLVAAGNFAAFSSGFGGRTLTFRDVVAGTSTTVATDASNTGFDVAANGDVVYSTNDGSQIVRFRNGTASVIASTATMLSGPVTDGINVVFTEGTVFANAVAIRLVGPAGLTTLTTRGRLDLGEYQVNNGWTAYRELGPTDQPQVWSRAPDDTRRQVSFFSGGGRLEALGPNGEVVYTAEGYDPQNGRFVSLPPFTSVGSKIGSGVFGRPLFRGTTLYVLIGRSVFTAHP